MPAKQSPTKKVSKKSIKKTTKKFVKKLIKRNHIIVKRIKALDVVRELKRKAFRVAIFGSARTQKGESSYQQVYDLAYKIGEKGFDVVTGGGPGMMEAANYGHNAGDKKNKAESIGLRIELSFEQSVNKYVEVNKEFKRFAERLETFAILSNIFVLTPGGIGTMLEFFYIWQLVQVKKMAYKPIILIGEMWKPLIYWVIDYPLKDKLISSSDFEYIYLVKDNKEAMALINSWNKQYKKDGVCKPIKSKMELQVLKKSRKK